MHAMPKNTSKVSGPEQLVLDLNKLCIKITQSQKSSVSSNGCNIGDGVIFFNIPLALVSAFLNSFAKSFALAKSH